MGMIAARLEHDLESEQDSRIGLIQSNPILLYVLAKARGGSRAIIDQIGQFRAHLELAFGLTPAGETTRNEAP